MRIEHIAFNVDSPREQAAWYAQNLGLTITRSDENPPYINFLADDNKKTYLEFYNNPAGEIADYSTLSFLTMHIAFQVDDIALECERLVAAGGTQVSDLIGYANGDATQFVRDPWGIAIQLIKRVTPFE